MTISRLLMTKRRRCSSAPGASVPAEIEGAPFRTGAAGSPRWPRRDLLEETSGLQGILTGAHFVASSGERCTTSGGLPAFVRSWLRPCRASLGSRSYRSKGEMMSRPVGCAPWVSFAWVRSRASLPGRVGGPRGPRRTEEPRTLQHQRLAVGGRCV